MRIFGLAFNYSGYSHTPIVFLKGEPTIGGEPIYLPLAAPSPMFSSVQPYLHTWPEPELGFRMGKDGILGFVLANDITCQIGKEDCHLTMSKARDSFCPMVDIQGNFSPKDVILQAFINDAMVVEGSTYFRLLHEKEAISFVEKSIKLHPGDVVLTGSPLHRKAPIEPGDIVRVEAWHKGKLLAKLENPAV